MATGEALLIMGDNHGAMQRYSRALDAPGSDRVEVRLALARLFAQSGRSTDAQDQVAFAMAEARVGESECSHAGEPDRSRTGAGLDQSI